MEKAIILNLEIIYESGPQFFLIPQLVAGQYNINLVADMKGHSIKVALDRLPQVIQ